MYISLFYFLISGGSICLRLILKRQQWLKLLMEVILRQWIQHFVSEVSVPFPCTMESFVVFCSTLERLVDSTLSLGFPLSWSWQSDLPNVRILPHRDRLIFSDLARKTQVSNIPTIVKNHLMIMLIKNFLPNKEKSFKISA